MSFLQSLGIGKKSPSVVGIDIGSSSIKAVQLRRQGGKAVLETYGAIALGPYAKLSVGQATNLPTEQIVAALKDLIKEANITTSKAAISIPLRSSMVKIIELPFVDQGQLNQMIPLEARKYIPVPISEVALDWWVLPNQKISDSEDAVPNASATSSNEKIEVLVVAIHNGIIKKFQDVASQAGLSLGTFEVETFSGIRSILSRDISTSVILDIGASTTKLIISDYGIVKVAHTINKGAQDISVALATAMGVPFDQAEEAKRREGLAATERAIGISHSITGEATTVMNTTFEYIFHESNRVIVDFERRYSRLVSKIVLTGGGSLTKGLLPLAQKSFEAEVVKGESFRNIEAPAFLVDVLKEAGPEFANAIGLAIRELSSVSG